MNKYIKIFVIISICGIIAVSIFSLSFYLDDTEDISYGCGGGYYIQNDDVITFDYNNSTHLLVRDNYKHIHYIWNGSAWILFNDDYEYIEQNTTMTQILSEHKLGEWIQDEW